MAPVLLDNRGLLKLGFVFFLSLVFVFGAGFMSGFYQASSVYEADNETAALELPEPVNTSDQALEQQIPNETSAGVDIDVDRPELEASSVAVAPSHAMLSSGTGMAETSETMASADKSLENVATDTAGQSAVHDEAHTQSLSSDSVTAQDNPTTVKVENGSSDSAVTKARLTPLTEKIRYTIQIGMYGRQMNAENLVAMLRAQDIDAYVSGFVNHKDEKRYNVRFGYFNDKRSALAALKEYKKAGQGDGYLVNFDTKDLINLAGVEDAMPSKEQTMDGKMSAPEQVIKDKPQLEKTTTSAVTSDASTDGSLMLR